jgi:hypothetical protein
VGSINFHLDQEELKLMDTRVLLVFRRAEQRRRRTEQALECYTVYHFTCVRGLKHNDIEYDFEKELGDFIKLEEALSAHSSRFYTGLPTVGQDATECGPLLERWLNQALHFYTGDHAVRDFIQPKVTSVWEWLQHPDKIESGDGWCPYSDETMLLLEHGYLNPSASTGHVNLKLYIAESSWMEYVVDLTVDAAADGVEKVHSDSGFWWQVNSQATHRKRLLRRRKLGIAPARTTHRIDQLPESWLRTTAIGESEQQPASELQPGADSAEVPPEPRPGSGSADVEVDGQLERQVSRLTRVEPPDPLRPSAHWGWDGKFPCMGRILKKASIRSEPRERATKQTWQLREPEIVRVEREAYEGELHFVYVRLVTASATASTSINGGWVKVTTKGTFGMGASTVLSFFNSE